MLCGLSVSYTVKIHGTIRRSFSLSLSSFTEHRTKPSKWFMQFSVIHHIPALLSYLCSIFKINAYILSVIIKLFFNALNLLI